MFDKSFVNSNGNLFAYAANNPVHYIDPDGREAGSTYSWVWLKGFRVTNDNGTGTDKTDDRVISERISEKPYKKSDDIFDSYEDAYNDAQDSASDYSFDRTGPSIEYHFDENDESNNYLEINIFTGLSPQGDGSTNESYEVNRWVIVEEQE